jgi:hypothetical protein
MGKLAGLAAVATVVRVAVKDMAKTPFASGVKTGDYLRVVR